MQVTAGIELILDDSSTTVFVSDKTFLYKLQSDDQEIKPLLTSLSA